MLVPELDLRACPYLAVQPLAPCALSLEGTVLGASQITWVGGRTILSAIAACSFFWLSSQQARAPALCSARAGLPFPLVHWMSVWLHATPANASAFIRQASAQDLHWRTTPGMRAVRVVRAAWLMRAMHGCRAGSYRASGRAWCCWCSATGRLMARWFCPSAHPLLAQLLRAGPRLHQSCHH